MELILIVVGFVLIIACTGLYVYLLNKENDKLVVKYIGAIDDNAKNPDQVNKKYLENAIYALMKGETPDPGHTKAIGCSIKHK